MAFAELSSLFNELGREPYIGEAVSQLQHAQQAAELAKRDGQPDEVVLGSKHNYPFMTLCMMYPCIY